MKELSQEIKVSNFAKYKRYLNNLIGEEITNTIFKTVGGEEVVMNGSFGMNTDSGSAYDGALIENALKIAEYAVKINDLLPENERVSTKTIYKIALLQHIAKVLMYTKNDNRWEIESRGILYKFQDDEKNRPTTLRCGEYSALTLLLCGLNLEPQEYEAMCILDKINSGDDSVRWYASTLSTVIRQANEIVNLINKNKARKIKEGKNEESK